MMPPFVVFPTNRIAHFVEVSLYLFYLAQRVMLVCDYIVESIDGDYAHLRRTDLPEEELKLVARALLPFDITEGCRLHYEMMQYSIID